MIDFMPELVTAEHRARELEIQRMGLVQEARRLAARDDQGKRTAHRGFWSRVRTAARPARYATEPARGS
jgi:hypothetical protein